MSRGFIWFVREHIPLKQGLRHRSSSRRVHWLPHVREHIPLKQGLRRHHDCVRLVCAVTVREHIPLKQGLRRLVCATKKCFFIQSESIFH